MGLLILCGLAMGNIPQVMSGNDCRFTLVRECKTANSHTFDMRRVHFEADLMEFSFDQFFFFDLSDFTKSLFFVSQKLGSPEICWSIQVMEINYLPKVLFKRFHFRKHIPFHASKYNRLTILYCKFTKRENFEKTLNRWDLGFAFPSVVTNLTLSVLTSSFKHEHLMLGQWYLHYHHCITIL